MADKNSVKDVINKDDDEVNFVEFTVDGLII